MVKSINEKSIFGQEFPKSIAAERAVLGAVLIDENALVHLEDNLLPSHFYDRAHATIYSVMLQLKRAQRQVDIVTVCEQLKKDNKLAAINEYGGDSYIISLCENVAAIGSLPEYADIIKSKALYREVLHKTAEMASRAFTEDSNNVAIFCDDIQKMILKATTKENNQHFAQLSIWLKRSIEELAKPTAIGISTGFMGLDRLIHGFKPGQLIIIGARPRTGKTAIALNMAMTAKKQQKNVLFSSLEMTGEALAMRIVCAEAGIEKKSIELAQLSSDEFLEVTNTVALLASQDNGELYIEDEGGKTVFDIRSRARALKMQNRLDMIIIDYLGRINPAGRFENRNIEISVISNALKDLALELRVPIIVLAQLSRALEKRVDKRPILSDLRDSGSIEQDADVILFLHRESLYNPEVENQAHTELIVAKNRNGQEGIVHLEFDGSIQKFYEIS